MKAAVLVEPGSFELRNIEEPVRPGPQQATVRILRVGICGTDLHAYRGRQPS
jgi:threonine dehydrogenase-like Zn-dependent dehydrogenase